MSSVATVVKMRLLFLFVCFCSCPFDYVTIYDGPDKLAPKIGTYCGQMRNLVIYSTKNMLYMTFTTLKRTAPAQNRGFFGLFEFSDGFVKLGKRYLQDVMTHFIWMKVILSNRYAVPSFSVT